MEPAFWLQRWQENKTGFHLDETNPHLEAYWPELERDVALAPGSRVFVPLCGKSLDLIWLANRGYRVCGIEVAESAVVDFFHENELTAEHEQNAGMTCWYSDSEIRGDIEIWCGDFFQLKPEQLGKVDAVYDRAALVAMPADLRPLYTRQLQKLCPATPQLLVNLDYAQHEMSGPPFSVERSELEQLYGNIYLGLEAPRACIDILATEPRFRERGLSRLEECVYILHRKD